MADDARATLAFQTSLPQVALTRVRSTLLIASYQMVNELGRREDYLRALPTTYHATVVDAVAGTWIDLETALAHYRACEALGMTSEAQVDVGRTVGHRIRATLAGTVVHMSKGVGVTPWTIVPAFPRFWGRLFEGSAIAGWKLGPKDVRFEVSQMPLVDVRYFRNAFRGQIMGFIELFCTRCHVHVSSARPDPGTGSFRIQWA